MTDASPSAPKFTELNNLASSENGSKILFATDDWFAAAENLLEVAEPEWKEGVFDDCGKWMDGWETRRKRIPGHDWCIIKLGFPGIIQGFDVDTAFFTGNYVPKISIQGANLTSGDEKLIPSRRKGKKNGIAATKEEIAQVGQLKSETWTTLVPKTPLGPGYPATRHTYIPIDNRDSWTHLRLNYFPDGGVARLRVYGQVSRPLKDILSTSSGKGASGLVDLIAMENGGICIGYSDAHYGHPRNLILPGHPVNMGDGWETARRLDRPEILVQDDNGVLKVAGYEWCGFKLGVTGSVSKIEVDTSHFKGNFPDSIRIQGCYMEGGNRESEIELLKAEGEPAWDELLSPQKLGPHQKHTYGDEYINIKSPINYVRVIMAPDGGIGRLRIWGKPKN